MVNVDNIKKLAARLREPDAAKHFDMSDYLRLGAADETTPLGEAIHTCGTAACIAGWATVMALPDATYMEVDEAKIGREFLGLTVDQSYALFLPDGVDFYTVTAEQAADVLDHLAETGEVVW